jgi:UDP-4-amino-4,6-dideoxy-N-acetyl-beta-L-altrosamine transaminase
MEPIPYSCQEIDESDLAAVRDVLTSAFLTQGPSVAEFEAAVASLHMANHAVAVCNATAALHIGCLALGLGAGDVLWTSPISFVASANCARYVGADVNFVDIDPITRNMSVVALEAKLKAAAVAGRLPKVVVPVDFSGLPCDLAEIRALADRYGFKILSDSSHAVGATFRGAPIGDIADITVFSFHPVKIVTTGEGGLCLTNDADIAAALNLYRSHGITRDGDSMQGVSEGPWYYEQILLGLNYRLTDIQAALGTSQLRRLASQHARRDALAARYDRLLANLPVKLPVRLSDRQSAHHLYVVELDAARTSATRSAVFVHLRAAGIGTNVHYIPIHLQPYYRALGFAPGDFPAAEAYYASALTLPLFPSMTEAQQNRIVDALADALNL